MHNRSVKIAFLATLIALVPLVTPAITHAAVLQDVATGYCFDAGTGPAYANPQCNSGDYQSFTLDWGDYGQFLRLPKFGGICMAPDAAPYTRNPVHTSFCNTTYVGLEQWTFTLKTISGGGQAWEIRNVGSGQCLDSNAAGEAYTLACNNGNYQRWIIYW